MKCAAIILAVVALATGLRAARLWWRASKAEPASDWKWFSEPVESDQTNAAWLHEIIKALAESADLNKRAAVWTAVSVIFGSASAVMSSLAPN